MQVARSAEAAVDSVGKVSLHDLIHDYCVRRFQQQFGDERALHSRLLDAYRRTCSDGWWTGPNDGYFLDHLRTHLVAAGLGGELADLLHELCWLEAKNAAGLVFDLLHDLSASVGALPASDDRRRILKLLDEALRRDIHFIARHAEDYPQALFQCLWNTCWWYDCPESAVHYDPPEWGWSSDGPTCEQKGPKLCTLLQRWRDNVERRHGQVVWFRSLRPPRMPLDAGRLAVFMGHTGTIRTAAWSADGMRILSAGDDGAIRVWNVATGTEEACLHVVGGLITSLAPIGDDLVAFALQDGTLRLWDVNGKKDASTVLYLGQSIWSVAYSTQRNSLALGLDDKSVRVWRCGVETHRFTGHDDAIWTVRFFHRRRIPRFRFA